MLTMLDYLPRSVCVMQLQVGRKPTPLGARERPMLFRDLMSLVQSSLRALRRGALPFLASARDRHPVVHIP
jgi:hypothetical protein